MFPSPGSKLSRRRKAPGTTSNIDASQVVSGTMATARLGSGTANSTTVLYGDQTYKTAPTAPASNYAPDVIVEEQQTSTTNSASSSLAPATFTTVTLNTLVRNVSSIASLASNQVTLPSGTYYAVFSCPLRTAVGGTEVKTKLRNITDSTDIIIGTSGRHPTANMPFESFGSGVFTIAASKALAVHGYTGVTGAVGVTSGAGVVEVFSRVQFWKIA